MVDRCLRRKRFGSSRCSNSLRVVFTRWDLLEAFMAERLRILPFVPHLKRYDRGFEFLCQLLA